MLLHVSPLLVLTTDYYEHSFAHPQYKVHTFTSMRHAHVQLHFQGHPHPTLSVLIEAPAKSLRYVAHVYFMQSTRAITRCHAPMVRVSATFMYCQFFATLWIAYTIGKATTLLYQPTSVYDLYRLVLLSVFYDGKSTIVLANHSSTGWRTLIFRCPSH